MRSADVWRVRREWLAPHWSNIDRRYTQAMRDQMEVEKCLDPLFRAWKITPAVLCDTLLDAARESGNVAAFVHRALVHIEREHWMQEEKKRPGTCIKVMHMNSNPYQQSAGTGCRRLGCANRRAVVEWALAKVMGLPGRTVPTKDIRRLHVEALQRDIDRRVDWPRARGFGRRR